MVLLYELHENHVGVKIDCFQEIAKTYRCNCCSFYGKKCWGYEAVFFPRLLRIGNL